MQRKLKVNKYRKIIIIILALLVTLSFSLKLDIIENEDIKEIKDNTSYFTKLLLKFDYSLDKDIFKSLLLFFLTALLLNKTIIIENSKQGKKVWKVLLSLLFSFFMVFGYSYYKINSWDMIFKNTFQLFKASIIFIGYYILFRAIINYIFDILIPKIQNTEVKESTNKIYNFIFVKHSFIMPLIIILICWLPYIIAYYPGNVWEDPAYQLAQFYGLDIEENSTANSNILIDENVKITNHHPVLHTILMGLATKLGLAIGNTNIGIFIYTTFQISLLIISFSCIINYTKKLKIPNWLKVMALLIFAFLPIIPIMGMQLMKDAIFTALIIIYIMVIYNFIKSNTKIKISTIIGIIILSILICLFRNNGIYVIIMSLPFVAIVNKENRKSIIFSTIIIIMVYKIITSILFPALKITDTGIREALSIPFQQTARYVKEHGNEVTEEEKKVIDNVLDYDTLTERYNPILSDPVKRDYNKAATNQELMEYFKIWFNQLVKHPGTYIQATMNNVYGYFYPQTNFRQFLTNYMIDSYNYINRIEGFNYDYIQDFREIREAINALALIMQRIPVLSWLMNIAFNVWIILGILTYLLYSKKCKYIIYLMPFLTIILICIASPVNAGYRYSMPFIFGMPLIVAIFIDIVKNEKNEMLLEKGNDSNEK